MQFSDLLLDRVIFEARYDPAYLFWDNAGKALAEIRKHYPNLELKDAKVSSVESIWPEEALALNFNYQKADVSQDDPDKLDNFKGVCAQLIATVQKHFEVLAFERVGVRFVLAYPAGTPEEAREKIAQVPLIAVTPEKIRAFGKTVTERQLVLRMEDEDKGFTVRLSHVTRKLQIQIPKVLKVTDDRFSKNVAMVDVDCYTKKRVDASILLVQDFVRINLRTLEDNLLRFLGWTQ